MPDPSDQPLSTDTILELLSHQRRRTVLNILQMHKGPLPLSDVAEEVAVRENETRIDAIPAKEVKQIYMALYHRHIPKLSHNEVLAYDHDHDMVAFTESAKRLMDVLDVALEDT